MDNSALLGQLFNSCKRVFQLPPPALKYQQQCKTGLNYQEIQKKDILTLDEAAFYIGTDSKTLLAEVSCGHIPGGELAGRWLFYKWALAQCFAEYRQPRLDEIDEDISESSAEESSELIGLNTIPAPDWEYYAAWMQCVKIRHLVRELQEKMQSGMNLHELVEQPTLNKLAEEIQELWWQTAVREEDLQIQHFDKLWDWEKQAKKYYDEFKLILETRVTRKGPEYRLNFRDKWNGEPISESNLLPIQIDWSPIESFWKDTRRFDYVI